MVGRLRYYRNDPQGMGRGAGNYYHRGNGVYSKYGASRDANRKAKTRIPRSLAGSQRRPGPLAHQGDTRVKGRYKKGRYF